MPCSLQWSRKPTPVGFNCSAMKTNNDNSTQNPSTSYRIIMAWLDRYDGRLCRCMGIGSECLQAKLTWQSQAHSQGHLQTSEECCRGFAAGKFRTASPWERYVIINQNAAASMHIPAQWRDNLWNYLPRLWHGMAHARRHRPINAARLLVQ